MYSSSLLFTYLLLPFDLHVAIWLPPFGFHDQKCVDQYISRLFYACYMNSPPSHVFTQPDIIIILYRNNLLHITCLSCEKDTVVRVSNPRPSGL
jgi:hypothetical protein